MTYGAFGLVECSGKQQCHSCSGSDAENLRGLFSDMEHKMRRSRHLFLSGDVAAVSAAEHTKSPCEVIAAAVISNPSQETVRLVEEDAAKHKFNCFRLKTRWIGSELPVWSPAPPGFY